MFMDYNYTFALRKDGNIYLWNAVIYREQTLLGLIYGAFWGAVVFFIPTLVFVLFKEFLDWLSNRAKTIKEENSNAT